MSTRNQQASVNTNGFTSYDNHFCSMGARHWQFASMLNFAPIKPEFVGKEAQKGDKVYEYEDSVSVGISPQLAVQLLQAFKSLQSMYEQDEEGEAFFTEVKTPYNEITLYAPGALERAPRNNKREADIEGKYVLKVIKKDKDGDITIYHVLENGTFSINDEEYVVNTTFELLVNFFKQIIKESAGSIAHTIRMNQPQKGRGAATRTKRRSFSDANTDDDEDMDTGGDEEEAAPRSSRTRTATRSTATRTSKRRSIEDAFDDDEE